MQVGAPNPQNVLSNLVLQTYTDSSAKREKNLYPRG